ncbi:RNA polymerase sigma factor [Microscilla marina]|uniref:Uncharacterized protein n=1 Tax=Microscilla marina ATCC 23134 TaxID=313606 RepID=A1ZYU5_MICM2|nr:sigma-70 family RNA polymerase sigma factor [Microscilla marina]EAY24442.1 hypothetical protein M23134_06296 [Microscilla marina ATCC 23134]
MNNKNLHKLLLKNPQKFIASNEIQEIIRKTAYKFTSRGGIYGFSKDDLTQEILYVILEKKIGYIAQNYNPDITSIQGYMSRVAFNICLELLRKQQNKPVFKNSLDTDTENLLINERNDTTPESSFIENEIIEREVERLKSYLKMFAKYQHKFTLLLKLYCRIILTKQDFKNFAVGFSSKELDLYYQQFNKEYTEYSDKEIYKIITPLLNKVETKKNSPDSIRKWLDSKVSALKEVMNQSPHYQYDTEAFKNLIRLL